MSSPAVWYLMRASGLVTVVLLTGAFSLGVATTRRWHPPRVPRFVTVALHRNISLLAVVFLVVHVATAVVDPYARVGLVATVVPLTAGRSALWVGLGALSLDLVAALLVTSLLRRHVGLRVWRFVHWAAYLAWPFALAHGLGFGSDGGALWFRTVTGACVGLVVVVVLLRVRRAGGASKHLDRQPAGVTHVEPRRRRNELHRAAGRAAA